MALSQNTDTKLLIYGLFQKGRVLAQDGNEALLPPALVLLWRLGRNPPRAPRAPLDVEPDKVYKVSGVSVTQSELAEALGVSARTIERWAAAGMPMLAKKAPRDRARYNLAQCRKWAAERPTQGRRNPTRSG